MKDHGILMSIDGPDYNVLKIKPPIVFRKENMSHIQYTFGESLQVWISETDPYL